MRRTALRLCLLFASLAPVSWAPTLAQSTSSTPQLVFIDTDIGDDIDDAFAIALALQSPDLRILGITTTFGDTALRARLLQRMLADTGHAQIAVAAGPPTAPKSDFTQRRYAERVPPPPASSGTGQEALDLFTRQIRAHPHQVTLIALGPLTTVEFLLDHDPAAFHLLRRVLMMGGSIRRGYDHAGNAVTPPEPEWNIVNGIAGAQKLLASGVPVTLLPLDSTQIPLDERRRQALFRNGSPATDALTLLYHEWGQQTPTLFDPLTIATAVNPSLCTTTPMRLRVDGKGNTLVEADQNGAAPNAEVCLQADREAFLDLLMKRLLEPPPRQLPASGSTAP